MIAKKVHIYWSKDGIEYEADVTVTYSEEREGHYSQTYLDDIEVDSAWESKSERFLTEKEIDEHWNTIESKAVNQQ